ncbi:uncharacterized protein LOC124817691 isoform X2 [Hydra vulgaris]|uniref:Uncharacterized protein LOC124817691 isoform X2 n=1 Tax=Hydra vulgaris TaxID=6087 RepID=A0ABM4CCQ6_HYDVU
MDAFQFDLKPCVLYKKKCLLEKGNEAKCVKAYFSEKIIRDFKHLKQKLRGMQALNIKLKNKNRKLQQMLGEPKNSFVKTEMTPFNTPESDEKQQPQAFFDTFPSLKNSLNDLQVSAFEEEISTRCVHQNQNNKVEPIIFDYAFSNEIEEHKICKQSVESLSINETPINEQVACFKSLPVNETPINEQVACFESLSINETLINEQVACFETKHHQIEKINETKSGFVLLKDVLMPEISNQTDQSSSSKVEFNVKENPKINKFNNNIPPLRINLQQFFLKQNKDLQDLKKKVYLFEDQEFSEFHFLESLLLAIKNLKSNMKSKRFFQSKSKIRKYFIKDVSQLIKDYVSTFCLKEN